MRSRLGGATTAHDGVLVDTDNAPAFVLGRGRARGIVRSARASRSRSRMLFARLDTPFVAVPDPQSSDRRQRPAEQGVPALYRHGAPGYRIIYQNNTWRLFARYGNNHA